MTVFHALALFDEVTVTSADTDSVAVTGEADRSVPGREQPGRPGRRRAARRRRARGQGRARPGHRDQEADPRRGGPGRGSADAAGALVACNELWGAGLSHAELAEVAARVGSDVGFALLGGTAVGLGRGDQVTPALAAGVVSLGPRVRGRALATPAVYAACDRLRAGRAAPPAPPQLNTALMAALRSGGPAELGPLLSNEVQPAAVSLLPRLRQALAAGRGHGALDHRLRLRADLRVPGPDGAQRATWLWPSRRRGVPHGGQRVRSRARRDRAQRAQHARASGAAAA